MRWSLRVSAASATHTSKRRPSRIIRIVLVIGRPRKRDAGQQSHGSKLPVQSERDPNVAALRSPPARGRGLVQL
jgi:hypothetical protein